MHDDDRRDQTENPDGEAGPSRSQQRREALAILTLAGQLVELPPSRLGKLALAPEVRDEIDSYRQMHANGARKRQLAFVAKKLRQRDDDELASLRAALDGNGDQQRRETAAMHRLEVLREQLLAGDEDALTTFIATHPDADRQHLRSLLRKARQEKEHPDTPPRAYREIFRLLKTLDTDNGTRGSDSAGA